MRRAAAIALLLAAVAAAQVSESAEGTRRYGDYEVLQSEVTFRFRGARIVAKATREDADQPRRFWRFGAGGLGRFGTAFLVPQGKLGAAEDAWMSESPDGTLLAHCRLPRLDGEGAIEVDMAELAAFPNWLFFRLTATAGRLPGWIVSARTGVVQPTMGGTPSRLHLAWPDGIRGAGEPPPWSGRQPRFDALAFFARGPEGDQGSDLLVFRPEDLERLRMPRWDSVAILAFEPAADCRQTILAFGQDPERNAEDLAIPQFFAAGRQRIAAAMASIEWTPPPADPARVHALVAEVADLLARYPNPDLAAELDRLTARAAALGPDEHGAVAPLERDLQALAERTASHGLRQLLARPAP